MRSKPTYKLKQRRKRLKPHTRVDKELLERADLFDLSGLEDVLDEEDEGVLIGRMVNEEKYQELINRVRYMNSWRQKGYRFSGTIPEPKEIGSYYPNDTW